MYLTLADFSKPLAHVQMLSQIRIRVSFILPSVFIPILFMLLACGTCKAVFKGNVEGPHATTVWEFKLVKLIFSGTAK